MGNYLRNLQEETEIRSDGTKKVIRPGQNGLARVSVLRGGGATAGKPFIDDYIFTTDPIVDLLTEYSGIHRKPFFLADRSNII
jgi:PAB-dependent poly(A)-specific ribonuclease subunit 2